MALHYAEAGKILDRISAAGAKPFSLKKMLYSKPDKKVSLGVVYALVTETLKYKLIIDTLLDESGVMKNKELHGKGHILHVMIYDLLIGKERNISGGGSLKKIIVSWADRLKSELVKMKLKYKVKDISELIPEHLRQPIVLPRWVRVNHLISTVPLVKQMIEKDGWVEIPFADFFAQLDELQASQNLENSSKTQKKMPKVYCLDRDLPDLLAFPPLTDFHEHQLLHTGHIVLQDKASALSGAALEVPAAPESVALDACAAPGQKTSQVAQSMKNLGRLFAFDLDKMRLETLKRLCKRNGLKNLTAVNGSFLDIDVHSEPYCDVEYILLDPSCSGSGIVNRLDYFLSSNSGVEHEDAGAAPSSSAGNAGADQKQLKERVMKLQEFQLSMIKKAFTFPKLQQLVYSTCSIHDEENEQVVELASNFSPHFEVAKVLPKVPMRGLSSYPHGELCVRTVPARDHTIGFFVSTFKRKAGPEHEPVFTAPKKSQSSKKRKSPTELSKPELKEGDMDISTQIHAEKQENTTIPEEQPNRANKVQKRAESSNPLAVPAAAASSSSSPAEPTKKPKVPVATSSNDPNGAKKKKNKNKPKTPSRPLVR
jgi:putative methyltransferase